MPLKLKNFPLSYDESVMNFVPKPLKKEKFYESIVRSSSKKESELEIKDMSLSQICSHTFLLMSLENRFWVYDKVLPYNGQSYNLCFKSFDLMLFNARKNKLINLNSLTYAYSARKHCLKRGKTRFLIKSRLLALTKYGFKLNFYGMRLLLKPFIFNPTKYRVVKRRKKVSYRSWLILNLNLIGLLSSFRIRSWTMKFFNPGKKKRFFARKWDPYYQGNLGFKLQIRVTKS